MIANIKRSVLCGTVSAPPSKSMAHRLLIAGGLSTGKSVVHGISPSEDVLATLDCLKAIGAEWNYDGDTVEIIGADVAKFNEEKRELFCRESGSTLRFFIPLCLIGGNDTYLYGSEKLLSRPLEIYENICRKQGIEYSPQKDSIRIKGRLSSGNFKIAGNISSQFISGLLFALPLLDGDSIIDIVPPIESCSYIKLTILALSKFGVKIEWLDDRTLFVKGSQSYEPREVWVEGDYSNAAFFDALNYLGSNVTVENLDPNSIQGDRVYKTYFDMMVRGTPTLSISDCPDLGPVLFAVAAARNGGIFSGTRRLKIKESDRGAAMAQELSKFGTSVTVEDDGIIVYPTGFSAPTECLYGHNDHRIVMSLSILLTVTGGTLYGAEAVNKSMPDFFEKMKAIGMEVELIDDK